MQFKVETAGVADGLARSVASPQGGGGRAAVGARQAHAPGGRRVALKQTGLLTLDERLFAGGRVRCRGGRYPDIAGEMIFPHLTHITILIMYHYKK